MSIYKSQTSSYFKFKDREKITFLNLVFHKILSSGKIDLNLSTKRGTALHLACRLNKVAYVKALIASGCDCEAKNADGYTPVDLTKNPDVKILFKSKEEEKCQKDNEAVFHINFWGIQNERKMIEKPVIVQGEMFKVSNLGFSINQRFFVLNPEEGTFIRFKKRSDYPMKPKFNKMLIF